MEPSRNATRDDLGGWGKTGESNLKEEGRGKGGGWGKQKVMTIFVENLRHGMVVATDLSLRRYGHNEV